MRLVSRSNLFYIFDLVLGEVTSITIPEKIFVAKIPPVSEQNVTEFVYAET